MNSTQEHFHFVTGRLAEFSVRKIVEEVADEVGFAYTIDVLPITVAALITPKWLMRHLQIPSQATRVVVPGYLQNDLAEIQSQIAIPVDSGPRDIRDLPMFFGKKRVRDATYGKYTIEIIAEINHAPRLSIAQLLEQAKLLSEDGANVIDLGCSPAHQWKDVGVAVRELTAAGLRVSIDSFDPWEVSVACEAGAELVLSVNSSNREVAVDWGTEVVVIPDVPGEEKSFKKTVEFLSDHSVSMRIDPILEPIGCGFAKSLERYMTCRREYPDAKLMMGIGNITELSDADSAGINLLLLGICQELGIESVLTTQVINWARTSVKECDLARRLLHYACENRIPPKHLEPDLVLLRDERLKPLDVEALALLADSIRDKNIRIFNSGTEVHAVSAGIHVFNSDPFETMRQLLQSPIGSSINSAHAFYLGFEMAKAHAANTLGKNYTQDEALNWGFLTREEDHHRLSGREDRK